MPEITFKYKFPQDYNPKYANGAFGGVGPKGEIIINFFLERQGIPHSQSHLVTDDGKIGPLTEQVPQDLNNSIVRYVDSGAVLSLETAKAIAEWLQKQIVESERIHAKISETKT